MQGRNRTLSDPFDGAFWNHGTREYTNRLGLTSYMKEIQVRRSSYGGSLRCGLR